MALSSDAAPETRAVPFATSLAAHGDRTALVTADGALSYRELAGRVARTGRQLGPARRLVLLAGSNTVDAVVTYLAALAGGHPVLLTPDGNPAAVDRLIAAYDPDVVAGPADGRWQLRERRAVSAHTLHPELALLLSTSGSTGSAKLVRLSADNLQSNAAAVAEYLGIRADDRAVTSLPMHYCYGLSVLNSHLLRGAAVVLTELSVADACFWELFRRHRVTTFAAVPYTFDLLDRVGFAAMSLPSLRYLTQAGGRLAPDRVRRYAELGQRNGWDLFVMYGQTEATARMAYLPPDLATTAPQAIGVPIPGGAFRLEPLPDWPEPDTGELIYTGPNVMLGYAETPADLGLGRTLDALPTGDIARRTSDGLYELVGRRTRFLKIFGLRIDLQGVEAVLERHGFTACCVGTDETLVAAVEAPAGDPAEHAGDPAGDAGPGPAATVQRLIARETGLPTRAVRVCLLPALPRLPTGKPDHRAVRDLTAVGDPGRRPAQPAVAVPAAPDPGDLRALFAEVLDRSDVTADSTFVSLGGDSLSYVEMSLRLEQAIGHLPTNWHLTRIADLRPRPAAPPRRRRSVDTSVALRAIAIVLIVGSHIELLDLPGGAHVLLGVAGYNFARFHLSRAERAERTRRLSASIARVVVPSMAWIALVHLLTNDYDLANVFLLNEVVGPRTGTQRYFWFVETLVYTLVALLAVFALPGLDRVERRWPFALPAALTAVALTARYDLPGIDIGQLPTPVLLFWLFALGWATAKANTRGQRLALTAVILVTLPGYFHNPGREAVVIGGLCLLVWVTRLPSTAALNRIVGPLAAGSLYIYLTHWQVYPYLDQYSGLLALLASLVVGVGYAAVATRAMALLTARLAGRPAAGDRTARLPRARTARPAAADTRQPAPHPRSTRH